MIKVTLEAWPSEAFDKKATAASMSAKETVSHLAECFVAVEAALDGLEYQWGAPPDLGERPQEVSEEFFRRRSSTAARLVAAGDKGATLGVDYLAMHEQYHIGQLCLLRMEFEPGWNAYSIYGDFS